MRRARLAPPKLANVLQTSLIESKDSRNGSQRRFFPIKTLFSPDLASHYSSLLIIEPTLPILGEADHAPPHSEDYPLESNLLLLIFKPSPYPLGPISVAHF